MLQSEGPPIAYWLMLTKNVCPLFTLSVNSHLLMFAYTLSVSSFFLLMKHGNLTKMHYQHRRSEDLPNLMNMRLNGKSQHFRVKWGRVPIATCGDVDSLLLCQEDALDNN